MTTPEQNFAHIRRQQFLTEGYYEELEPLIQKNINWLKLEDFTSENDKYNCGEANQWFNIASKTWKLLQLEYTAGKPIEQLADYLEQVIIARENQARAKAAYFKTDQDAVLGGSGEGYLLPLQLMGLAYLLNRRDLLPRIKTLVEGEGDMFEEIDDNNYVRLLRYALPKLDFHNVAWNDSYANLYNALYEGNTTAEALSDLTAYLKEWYLLHEDHFWHDSHLDLENNDKYVGYWAFEAAAVVYLLNLDDTSLHQFLYYPKDLVEYARTQQPASSPMPNRYTGRTLRVGETCTSTGWYEALLLNNRREHFTAGQIIEGQTVSAHGQTIVWYELTSSDL